MIFSPRPFHQPNSRKLSNSSLILIVLHTVASPSNPVVADMEVLM